VLYDPKAGLCEHHVAGNDWVLAYLDIYHAAPDDVLVIEQIASMGMAVGQEVFDTVRWAGRFEQLWRGHRRPVERVKRIHVKVAICGQSKANDANIRTALIDRFGGIAATKKGGVLYKVAGDAWAALAVAVAYSDPHALPHTLLEPQ
jgi:hypothetical protein